jgi:hypothetical protein
MYLNLLLRIMLVVSTTIIVISVLGLLLVVIDIVFLHDFGYPLWALAVIASGIVIALLARIAIRAWLADHGSP